MSNPSLLQRIHDLIQENQMQKRAYMRKAAAQPPMGGMPPMDPGMMGGMPPMDPGMMGGMPPADPSMMGGMPPADPSMMGGMSPMDPSMMSGAAPVAPAAEEAAAPAAAAAEAAAPKKLKPDEYMAKLDTRLYNLQVQVAALMKKLNVEVPPEALIVPPSDQEVNLDNPNPQLLDVGSGGSAEEPPQSGGDMGLPPELALPPEMGGETPKVASYHKRTQYNPEKVAQLLYGLKRLY